MINKKSDRFEVTEVELTHCWGEEKDVGQGFCIEWSTKGAGFGMLTLGIKNGEVFIDSECMGPDFCKAVFAKLVDKLFEAEKLSSPRSFPVTDDTLDAPDGAIVDGYERVGDQWIKAED